MFLVHQRPPLNQPVPTAPFDQMAPPYSQPSAYGQYGVDAGYPNTQLFDDTSDQAMQFPSSGQVFADPMASAAMQYGSHLAGVGREMVDKKVRQVVMCTITRIGHCYSRRPVECLCCVYALTRILEDGVNIGTVCQHIVAEEQRGCVVLFK